MASSHGFTQQIVNGYPAWVNAAGRVLPVVRGGADGDPLSDPPAKVEFTPEQHAEMNRIIVAREAEAARKAARDTKSDLDAYLAAEKATADRAKLEGEDRLKAELADAQAKALAAEQTAAMVQKRADATTALLAAGLNPANTTDALRLIDLDAADQAAEITGLAERLPALFTATGPASPPPAGIIPPRPPVTSPGGQTAAERAKARFVAAHPQSAA